jgi:lipid A 3-O-deacylase
MGPLYACGRAFGSATFACAWAIAAAIMTLMPARAIAAPPEELAPFFAIGEFRAGVFDANLDGGDREDAEYMINVELLFGRPFERAHGDSFRDFLLRPRPHIGFSVSPDDGTDQLYAGFTWEVKLTDRIFVEASFGGALHDGPTGSKDPESYGCAVNFRESASLGVDLTERMRLMVTVDHMSNGGLCDQNEGLTNAGVRLGYRW